MDQRSSSLVLVSAMAFGLFLPVVEAEAAETNQERKIPTAFDKKTLKLRGIDAKLVDYFREAPRFREGRYVVTLVVNGARLGLVEAQFDRDGKLCFNRELLDKANLVNPEPGVVQNIDFTAAFPRTIVDLRPTRDEVSLIVPTSAFRAKARDLSGFTQGGTAGMFNYDVMGMGTRYAGVNRRYFSIGTEAGFNMADWIVRSRQLYTSDDHHSRFAHLYTYAQRTFTGYQSIFQAGQLNIASPVFAGAAISGIQILPEHALHDAAGGVVVDGIAQGPARVEVRQAGTLIYSTAVPAGPFSLADMALLNGHTDLDVTVIEADGGERRFVVPTASFSMATWVRPGYSLAVGKVRNLGDSEHRLPWVITGAGSWNVSRDAIFTAGLISDGSYQALGTGFDSAVLAHTTVSVRSTLSNAGHVKGVQASVSVSSLLSEAVSASISAARQTFGYRDLLDTVADYDANWMPGRSRGQYSASLGWRHRLFGGFNVSYSRVTTFDGVAIGRVIGSWGKTFKYATITANFEKSIDQSNRYGGGDAFYLNLSIPLGRRDVRTYVSHRNNDMRVGAALSERINDYASYYVTTDYDNRRQKMDVSGNLSLLPRYTQANVGYTRYGSGSTSYTGQMRGGVALHRNGVTFSPYPIQETFGIVSIGDLSGVKVSTPYGPVWSDAWGQAVIAQLPAYRHGRIEVSTKTLPRNVDVKNGFALLEAGRGSINTVDFGVIKMRRVLLRVTDAQGRPLRKGSSVLGMDGKFVTIVADDGKIFLANGQLAEKFTVVMHDETRCALHLNLPEKVDTDVYYETANAVCHM